MRQERLFRMLSQYYVIDRNVGVNKMTVASAIRRERVLAFLPAIE